MLRGVWGWLADWHVPRFSLEGLSGSVQDALAGFLVRTTLGRFVRSREEGGADGMHLHDLEVDTDAVNALMPLSVPTMESGRANEMTIKMPWSNVYSGRIDVNIRGVHAVFRMPESLDEAMLVSSFARASIARESLGTSYVEMAQTLPEAERDALEKTLEHIGVRAQRDASGEATHEPHITGAYVDSDAPTPLAALLGAMGGALVQRLHVCIDELEIELQHDGRALVFLVPRVELGAEAHALALAPIKVLLRGDTSHAIAATTKETHIALDTNTVHVPPVRIAVAPSDVVYLAAFAQTLAPGEGDSGLSWNLAVESVRGSLAYEEGHTAFLHALETDKAIHQAHVCVDVHDIRVRTGAAVECIVKTATITHVDATKHVVLASLDGPPGEAEEPALEWPLGRLPTWAPTNTHAIRAHLAPDTRTIELGSILLHADPKPLYRLLPIWNAIESSRPLSDSIYSDCDEDVQVRASCGAVRVTVPLAPHDLLLDARRVQVRSDACGLHVALGDASLADTALRRIVHTTGATVHVKDQVRLALGRVCFAADRNCIETLSSAASIPIPESSEPALPLDIAVDSVDAELLMDEKTLKMRASALQTRTVPSLHAEVGSLQIDGQHTWVEAMGAEHPILAIDLVEPSPWADLREVCVVVNDCRLLMPRNVLEWAAELQDLLSPLSSTPSRGRTRISCVLRSIQVVATDGTKACGCTLDVVSVQMQQDITTSASVQFGEAALVLHGDEAVPLGHIRDVHIDASVADASTVDVLHARLGLAVSAEMLLDVQHIFEAYVPKKEPTSGMQETTQTTSLDTDPVQDYSSELADVEQDAFCEPVATSLDELPAPHTAPAHRLSPRPEHDAFPQNISRALLEEDDIQIHLLNGATIAPKRAYYETTRPVSRYERGAWHISLRDFQCTLDLLPEHSLRSSPALSSAPSSTHFPMLNFSRTPKPARRPFVVVHARVQGVHDLYMNQPLLTRTEVVVHELEILDECPTSTWHTFLARDTSLRDPHAHIGPLACILLHSMAAAEHPDVRVKARVAPLRLYIDQDVKDFLESFGERLAQGDSAAGSSTPFIRYAEILPVHLKLDYKPKRIDYNGLQQGSSSELINLFHFDASVMVLRCATVHGLHGWAHLFRVLDRIWAPDVRANQIADVVAGIAPVRTVVNLGAGLVDLVLLPVEQYQSDGNLVRGLHRGASGLVQAAALETLRIGAQISAGTQVLLERAEHMLGGDVAVPLEGETLEASQVFVPDRVSVNADAPRDMPDAARQAWHGLHHGVQSASRTILAVPRHDTASDGRSVVRAIPVAMLQGATGATDASRRLFVGMQTALDPQVASATERKYKRRDASR